MGHSITALIVPGSVDADAAIRWDLVPIPLHHGLSLLHLTHYYTMYWQAALGITEHIEPSPEVPILFPTEGVVRVIAADLSARPDPSFAVVYTDYHAGVGDQWAATCTAGGTIRSASDINAALRMLGITGAPGLDEFDTVGLGAHRSTPEYLDRYIGLCDEMGL
ncbi:hypothetical protein [Nocardia sp. BMG111209]|uniref:hypothetical protein n=1 Tax=Nocardia sp. BMG111209 TaxID=1160137 RepID=UPI000371A160|nr:hypothetical protein [Nocardia sp. BMG111209]